jgi:N-methylhydantoinase A/oxoprolinase/acetone carboxylase beta subunit
VTIKLGIDTGGTYTDAVLFDDDKGVVKTAKSLTTKHDLSIGIGKAVRMVLDGQNADEIALVSVSTTLATNAIVEQHGAPACLVMIGFGEEALERGGLGKVVGKDPVVFVEGGHRAQGHRLAPLDREAIVKLAADYGDKVSAFAVAARFAVRNPAHENEAKELLRDLTGKPVTCSHELAADLDAPRRALTAVLNARLIFLLQQLVDAVQNLLDEEKVTAPLMVVQGDGSLITAEMALNRPVETILSGPAASLVGAQFLTDEKDMIVSDMGGTTSDVAVLRDGRPVLDESGAVVGGFRTMVRAVSVRTYGLGGDSEIRWEPLKKTLVAGPRRTVPLSLLVYEYPAMLDVLRKQVKDRKMDAQNGVFVLRLRSLLTDRSGLSKAEIAVWDALESGPLPMTEFDREFLLRKAVTSLENQGLLIRSAFTPSDASHVLGRQANWNAEGGRLGAELWSWPKELDGWEGAETGEAISGMVVEQVVRQTAECLVATALEDAGLSNHWDGGRLGDALVKAAAESANDQGMLNVNFKLSQPIVGIGAPAALYYGPVAERLSSRLILPPSGDVCNAVGAVAASVTRSLKVLMTVPAEGLYRVHLPSGNLDFKEDLDAAWDYARTEGRAAAEALAREAGATDLEVQMSEEQDIVDANGKVMFLEGRLFITVSGRPRLAVR